MINHEEELEPPAMPNLADVMALVETLTTTPRMGRPWRKAALALADIELGHITGLVHAGEPLPITVVQEFAACGCKNGLHPFVKDQMPWFGRGHWQEDEADARKMSGRVFGHVLERFVAYTSMRSS